MQLVLPIIDTRHKTCFYSTIKKISTSKQLISNQKHLVAPSIYLLFYSSIDFDIKTDVHFNVEIIENVKGENTNILQTQAVFASLVRFEKFDMRRKQLLLLWDEILTETGNAKQIFDLAIKKKALYRLVNSLNCLT